MVFEMSPDETPSSSYYEDFADNIPDPDQQQAEAPSAQPVEQARSVSDTLADTHQMEAIPGSPASKELGSVRAFIMRSLVAALVLGVAFFAFVAWRNDWILSLRDLPEQIEIAVFGRDTEQQPGDLDGIKVELGEGYKLIARDKRTIMVVNGRVVNETSGEKTDVLLRGSIIGSDGDVLFEMKAPCGRVRTDAKLKRTPKGRIEKYYKKRGQYRSCNLESGSTKPYQIVFDSVPSDLGEPFKVRVTVASVGTATEPDETGKQIRQL